MNQKYHHCAEPRPSVSTSFGCNIGKNKGEKHKTVNTNRLIFFSFHFLLYFHSFLIVIIINHLFSVLNSILFLLFLFYSSLTDLQSKLIQLMHLCVCRKRKKKKWQKKSNINEQRREKKNYDRILLTLT